MGKEKNAEWRSSCSISSSIPTDRQPFSHSVTQTERQTHRHTDTEREYREREYREREYREYRERVSRVSRERERVSRERERVSREYRERERVSRERERESAGQGEAVATVLAEGLLLLPCVSTTVDAVCKLLLLRLSTVVERSLDSTRIDS